MPKLIDFNIVADIYDSYVRTDFDIPFFLKETEGFDDEILELMCGTGRVSIPLLQAGRKLSCVDYSQGMLDVFSLKIHDRNFPVQLISADVINLDLKRIFGLILLPFHSFSEIISAAMQKKALTSIAKHLKSDGVFILTLQNPVTRLKLADGITRNLGEFETDGNRKVKVAYNNLFDSATGIISGFQTYEIYDGHGLLKENRKLEISFRPVSHADMAGMLKDAGLQISSLYGDYSYSPFDENTSQYMIYKLKKNQNHE